MGETSEHWGMNDSLRLEGTPFVLARSSCRHATLVARDVSIDEAALQRFCRQLDVRTVQNILQGSMGENSDTLYGQFCNGRAAANFALFFSLLQFGHGFRYDLHRLCGRGASQTITLGVRALHATGELSAAGLRCLRVADIQQAFGLPPHSALIRLVRQLHIVLQQAGMVLERLGLQDLSAFCQRVIRMPEAKEQPAATLVRQLANQFPAFNDQGVLHDGSRVVLVKKATLAVGELRRLAAPHDSRYGFSQDFHEAIAPVDNVIPAMLVYHGILRLSPMLHRIIHLQRLPLARSPLEVELRAVALDACERMVAATGRTFTSLELGYYLWRSGKEKGARQFARHHTQDTVFY